MKSQGNCQEQWKSPKTYQKLPKISDKHQNNQKAFSEEKDPNMPIVHSTEQRSTYVLVYWPGQRAQNNVKLTQYC